MSQGRPLSAPERERRAVQARVGRVLTERLAAVSLLVVDCDGILTDGSLYYGPEGEALKVFDARDGLGLMMLRAGGIARAVLTGRTSPMVARRCCDLGFESIKMARFDKAAALAEICRETGCEAAATLYMGDDVLDLPALAAAGLAVTVPGAPCEVRDACALVTETGGGRGAVREVCDLLLRARGAFATALAALIEIGPSTRNPGESKI
ncbi:MAG: HAD hydrolase family protein [Candidatus Krumholzibacteria bacterium]|jgi:3-deoxy-D-manno-octulosonate 8-phosphate phosphatase (KDO 8-P phosphatase)|nr:HAD hydrolase family protein [Candidatus Krumholzibacteria bacterium]